MAVRLSALRTGRTLLTKNTFLLLVLISVRGWVNPRTQCSRKHYVNWKKKKIIHIIGSRTRDLPACWTVLPVRYHVSSCLKIADFYHALRSVVNVDEQNETVLAFKISQHGSSRKLATFLKVHSIISFHRSNNERANIPNYITESHSRKISVRTVTILRVHIPSRCLQLLEFTTSSFRVTNTNSILKFPDDNE
jgi:hypothetical protein